MYSLVVMAALTTGGETPEFFHRRGCGGCYAASSCGGYGCWGYGGYYSSGNGCWGGSWNGCAGSCNGCWGGSCHGCAGSCYGSNYGTCYGCHGCYGCYGTWGCYGWAGYEQHQHIESVPIMPAVPKDDKGEKKGGALPDDDRARVVVELPADARLYIDDQVMKTTSARRTFSTPKLEKGQTYYYILKVEVVRDGATQAETRRLLIRPGDVVNTSFSEESIAAASKAPDATAAK